MDVSMKYRTQGSLPISAQHKALYMPKIQEEPLRISREKVKQEALLLRTQTGEDEREQSIPKIQPQKSAPTPAPKPEPYRFRIPAHDPSKAIIETSPYYIYFQIVTTKNGKQAQDKDLKSILNELIIIDEDLPKTAKYRHFKSYVQ